LIVYVFCDGVDVEASRTDGMQVDDDGRAAGDLLNVLNGTDSTANIAISRDQELYRDILFRRVEHRIASHPIPGHGQAVCSGGARVKCELYTRLPVFASKDK